MIKKLFSHTALYGLAPQLPKIASLFVLPIITKYLTEEDYGIAGLVGAYTTALDVLQSLGISVILANSFYKQPGTYKWLWRQLHGFISLWSIPYGFLLATVLYFGIPEAASQNRLWIILLNVAPPMFFSTTQIIVFRYYQMSGQPQPLAVRAVALGVLTVLLNLYFIAELQLGYMGWFLSTFVSSVLNFIIFAYLIYVEVGLTPIFNFKWRTIKKSLKVSLPTVPHYYSAYLLDSSDRLVLDWLRVGTSNVGLYSFASNFGSYFSALGNAVGFAVNPMYINFLKQAETNSAVYHQARALTFFVQSGFLGLVFLAGLWMREVFYLLVSNDELREIYPLAIIIVAGYAYRPMYLGASALLFYHERTARLWQISFVAGAANVLLNLIFIPMYGYQAAALTTFAALMYMGYSGYFIRDYQAVKNLNYYPLRWLAITCSTATLSYYLRDIDIRYKIVITVTILAVGLGYFAKSNTKKLLDG